jgi:hypothetical protein
MAFRLIKGPGEYETGEIEFRMPYGQCTLTIIDNSLKIVTSSRYSRHMPDSSSLHLSHVSNLVRPKFEYSNITDLNGHTLKTVFIGNKQFFIELTQYGLIITRDDYGRMKYTDISDTEILIQV